MLRNLLNRMRRIIFRVVARVVGASNLAVLLSLSALLVSWSIYQNQDTHHAWGRISSHMPGNSGIRDALEYLNNKGADLQNIDLRPIAEAYAGEEDNLVYVHGVNLNHADLTHAWLNKTDFSNAKFIGAILTNVFADEAVFTKADFTKAMLKGAKFRKTNLRYVTMINAMASGLYLDEATAIGAKFDQSKMMKSSLYKILAPSSSFLHVNFGEAQLQRGRFNGSTFEDAIFSKTDVSDAHFRNANLSGADFSTAVGLDLATLKGAWTWNDKLPRFSPSTAQPLMKYGITIYFMSCREKWLSRVKTQTANALRSEVTPKALFRPPDDPSCITTKDTHAPDN